MSGDQTKSTAPGAEQAPHPPTLPQYPQPFPGTPYPPPPGAYTWYYPPPADPNGDPNAPPPGPYVMFPPPGMMYAYPPPPAPTQGYGAFSAPAPAVVTRAKRKQVKMACTNCASACKRCDEARPCQRCQKYGLSDSCVDGVRKARKVGIKRGPYKRKSKLPASDASSYSGFPPNGEGAWPAASDQANGVPSGAAPAIPPQYLPPEGYWPYPYYPPPPGYVAPPPDGHANGDSSPHGQPAHHPAYYPIHPGYPPVPIYPPPPGAYGPIPVPPGQAPPIEQTAGNQTATSDDERPSVERPKKKKRSGGEDGTSKSSKKSKRVLNSVNEAVVAVSAIPIAAPPSDDSPDDHGSPIAHSRPASGGDEPLPPVIAAA